jgi:hypothetical protein
MKTKGRSVVYLLFTAIYYLSFAIEPVSSSVIFHEDKSSCPPNLSGPECTIPSEDCGDGLRRCYNNSRCVRNTHKNPVTGEYGYSCDCTTAESISKVAGHECEHSATEICDTNSGGNKNYLHFCTNGGVCGSFVYRAQVHTGCHCPRDYAGAHCQYLKALGDFNYVVGEKEMEDVGVNFYAFSPTPTESKTYRWLTVGLTAFVLTVVGFAFLKGVTRSRRRYLESCRTMDERMEAGVKHVDAQVI